MKAELLIAVTIGIITGILLGVAGTNARNAHECPVAFVNYIPDIVASQTAMGVEPDGKPFEDFGRAWIKAELDADMALVFKEFRLEE